VRLIPFYQIASGLLTQRSIQGFKSIGYVQLFPSPPSSYVRAPQKRTPPKPVILQAGRESWATAMTLAALVLLAAFAIPYLSSSPAPKK
jgi:hypothetical protein